MSKFHKAMCMGLGLLAAVVAAPVHADAQDGAGAAGSVATPITRVKRIGTRMETIIVLGGAVDPQGQRWVDSGKVTAVLPTVSDSAFLDAEGADSVATPDSRP